MCRSVIQGCYLINQLWFNQKCNQKHSGEQWPTFQQWWFAQQSEHRLEGHGKLSWTELSSQKKDHRWRKNDDSKSWLLEAHTPCTGNIDDSLRLGPPMLTFNGTMRWPTMHMGCSSDGMTAIHHLSWRIERERARGPEKKKAEREGGLVGLPLGRLWLVLFLVLKFCSKPFLFQSLFHLSFFKFSNLIFPF